MEVSIAVALLAGISSFFAPCILPIIPAFLAYISGTTISDLKKSHTTNVIVINKSNVMLNTIFFVLGFSIVFSAIGVAINSIFVLSANEIISNFNHVGGVIIIGFGVFMILSSKIHRFNFEKRIFPSRSGASYPLSFVFGLAFAAGWTPCVGPILGSILTLATTTPEIAFNLLLSYSIGVSIPFIIMGVFISQANSFVRKISNQLKYFSILLGSLIIILGILVFLNQLTMIASFPFLNNIVSL
jgi:cytochrome c-type biogenesis protein|tara:strand:- start:18 stop:746 length:729 start_codon:yes stop_codon:yes gene_type:complete